MTSFLATTPLFHAIMKNRLEHTALQHQLQLISNIQNTKGNLKKGQKIYWKN